MSKDGAVSALRGRLFWFVGDPHAIGEAAHRYVEDGLLVNEGVSAAVLDEAKARLAGTVEVSSVVVLGDTVEDAVNGLDWHPGDLIMVGSSRLAAPRRLFLGSTAAKMLRVLDVPMVVVPRAGLT